MKNTELDPKGLIKDSYAIDGITESECRSIFLDWALGVADPVGTKSIIQLLLDVYAPDHPNHPMTKTLRYGLEAPAIPVRRGGRKSRL